MKSVLEFTKGRKITMLTAYDHWSARLLNGTDVDCLLVGDSSAMVMHGYPDTVQATTEMLAVHTRAVRLGAPDKFLIADMPFLTFGGSLDRALDCVRQLMAAGAQAVKLEGACELVRPLVGAGIPVMGHLGLTPQSVHALGGYKVQGRGAAGDRLVADAVALQEAGCFALVLECIPSDLGARVTRELTIPTIGIGAGPDTDGQVLVLQDMLGAGTGSPKFVRRYADLAGVVQGAVASFTRDVREGAFPAVTESYSA